MLLWLSHPDEQMLARYVSGELNDQRVAAQIMDHLERCEQCRADVEGAQDSGSGPGEAS
jgi:hypothetical protein